MMKSNLNRLAVTLFVLMVPVIWGQDCTADDGTDGVELWGECYSIENTTSLNLESSGLTGEIPESIGNLTNLTDLRLQGNQLAGSIPQEIGNLTNLTELRLYNNELTGSIPPEIGNLTNLNTLMLDNNQLTGEIPETICSVYENIPSSGTFNISNNQLCPPYPEGVEDYVGEQDCQENSISEQPVPITYNLSSPYPNPFNPSTTIQFSLPQSEMVSMKVYDLNGRLIETLLNDFYDMGNHTITWDGSSQSSGMYFVRLESGEYIQTRKVVLVQ